MHAHTTSWWHRYSISAMDTGSTGVGRRSWVSTTPKRTMEALREESRSSSPFTSVLIENADVTCTKSFTAVNFEYANVISVFSWSQKPRPQPGHRHSARLNNSNTLSRQNDLLVAGGSSFSDLSDWVMAWEIAATILSNVCKASSNFFWLEIYKYIHYRHPYFHVCMYVVIIISIHLCLLHALALTYWPVGC